MCARAVWFHYCQMETDTSESRRDPEGRCSAAEVVQRSPASLPQSDGPQPAIVAVTVATYAKSVTILLPRHGTTRAATQVPAPH